MPIQSGDNAQRKPSARWLSLLAVILATAGCTEARDSAGAPRSAIPSIIITPTGLNFSVKDEREVTATARRAGRLPSSDVTSRPGSQRIAAAEVPFLSLSPEGKDFLDRAGPRALAIGAPAGFCPVSGLSDSRASTAEAAAASALTRCLAALPPTPVAETCGCKLAALNNIILLPREDTAYATGVTARLYAPSLKVNGIFVAEEVKPNLLILRDLQHKIAELAISDDGRARLSLNLDDAPDAAPTVFTGPVIDVGWRRGRIARRLYLQDAAGRRVSLLLGFTPQDLTDYAAAWLAFPPDLPALVAGDQTGRGGS